MGETRQQKIAQAISDVTEQLRTGAIDVAEARKRIAVINPKEFSMSDAVAIMTGAMKPPAAGASTPAHDYQLGEEVRH